MTARDEFEKWLEKTYDMSISKFDEHRNCYPEFSEHIAWTAWQADARQLALSKQPIDAALLAGDAVSSMDQLRGLRLRHAVRSGLAVRLSDFESIPDVDNRQQVRVIASAGAITIESSGIAMRAGNKGDVVPIQMAHAQEPVRATITDRGVAQVVP